MPFSKDLPSGVYGGADRRRCVKCGNTFVKTTGISPEHKLCPDCDPVLQAGDTQREVILSGGEGLRITRGMEMLHESEAFQKERTH